jgi:hypothetical protein
MEKVSTDVLGGGIEQLIQRAQASILYKPQF